MDHVDLAQGLFTLPRSVLLALWLEALAAPAPDDVRRAVRAVQGDDEPHAIEDVSGSLPAGGDLDELVAAWSGTPREVAAVLPAPGDPLGVPAVATADAIDAGECVLVWVGHQGWAAVPQVIGFGSAYEPGHLVTWTVHRVPDWRRRALGACGSLAEAEQGLGRALTTATDALAALDVARWRPDAADAIAALRGAPRLDWPLPDGVDARRRRVLVSASRLRAIVALATADDGGAVNLWQADQRSTALREVDRAARLAMSAAAMTPPLPSGREVVGP